MNDPATVAAFFTGLATLITAAGVTYVQLRKIHQAVNSNMTKALNEISDLRDRLEAVASGLEDPGSSLRTPAPKRREGDRK